MPTKTDAVTTRSFDIFDTLLVRPFITPDLLYPEIARAGLKQGIEGAGDFARVRRAGEEAAARSSPAGEATIAEIYEQVQNIAGWPARLAATWRDLELSLELNWLQPVPAMRERVRKERANGHRIAFVSDMWLPSSYLREALLRHGIAEEADEIIVSCEQRASKRHATIYPLLVKRWGTNWKHYGDNPHADVATARSCGIEAELARIAVPTDRELQLARDNPSRPEIAGLSRLARLQAVSDLPIWQLGANVAGPVLDSFTRWIVGRARAAGIKRLYFLARDGYIPSRMAALIAPDLQSLYLPASRHVWQLADFDPRHDALDGWVLDTPRHTPRAYLANLDLQPEPWSRQLSDLGLPPETWDEERPPRRPMLHLLRRFIQEPAVSRHLCDARALRRSSLERQLRELGFFSEPRVAIVDLGWKASLQRLLLRFLATTNHPPSVHGFYLALDASPAELDTQAFLYHPADSSRYLSLYHIPVECLAPAPYGQLTGLRSEPDGIKPVFSPHLCWAETRIHQLTEAALTFTRLAQTTGIGPEPYACRTLLESFIRQPNREEARAMAEIRFNACIVPGERLIPNRGPLATLGQLFALNSAIPWPEGLWARHFGRPGRFAGWMLRNSIRIKGRIYRSARHIIRTLFR